MEPIQLDNELSIKKLDPNNEKDVWLARELDNDPLIVGGNGYLWSIEETMKRAKAYLSSMDIYHSPYAIYHKQNPVGYIELSYIHEVLKYIEISYALLNQERGKGYATKTLTAISRIILEDIINNVKSVSLIIDISNIKSQMVAIRSGFVSDGLSEEEHKIKEYITYQKTQRMLYEEQHRK